jgi:hypothetical protein
MAIRVSETAQTDCLKKCNHNSLDVSAKSKKIQIPDYNRKTRKINRSPSMCSASSKHG